MCRQPFTSFHWEGGTPVRISGRARCHWSRDGSLLSIAELPFAEGRSYIVPLPPGEALPAIPAGGFDSEAEVAGLPGARRTDALEAVRGSSSGVYAF